jgi:stage V sporulation protein SpoVS
VPSTLKYVTLVETIEQPVAETRAMRRARLEAQRITHVINIKSVSNVRTIGQIISLWFVENPGKRMQLRMVGAGAVNQGTKSVARASQILQRRHQLDLVSRTSFVDGFRDDHGVIPSVVVLTLEVLP